MTAVRLLGLLRKKEICAAEIAQSFCSRIQKTEPCLNAFIFFDAGRLAAEAKAADERRAAGEASHPLLGLPVGLKDNICTKGAATTCASRMLHNFMPPFDAAVARRLKRAGAIMAGKMNMDEFAMGSSCESSWFGATKNPWDIKRVPGGSSGGSAAAVAAGQLPFALGSDTGGSVRQPAAFCGVIGLRPTYGAVSRSGLVAFASSLDQIGPLARSADDAALLFSVICGRDFADATSRDGPHEWMAEPLAAQPPVKGIVIGVPQEYFGADVRPAVKSAVETAVQRLVGLGARVTAVRLPSTRYALAAYHVLSSAEASSNLARFDGIRYGFSPKTRDSLPDLYEASRSEGFGDEVKRRIMLGTFVLSGDCRDACYRRAKAVQRHIAAEFDAAFRHCDMIITPTAPATAFLLGEKLQNPTEMYAFDRCTAPASMAGLPAVSFPCGLDEKRMPIGAQLIGPAFSERKLLEAVKAYELAVGGFPCAEVPS